MAEELSRESSRRGGALADAHEAIERARQAVDQAWTLTIEAQEAMRKAKVPELVVARLDDARLRLLDTDEYREVASLVNWKGRRDG